jgi:DNA-binding response OmpR family regulator
LQNKDKTTITAQTNRQPPYRVLIVDDEPDIALALKMDLEQQQGFQVTTFNDPKEALANFRIGVYDLILLDIKMPKLNGFELYEEIRKADDKIKVCFITAFEVYSKSLKELFPNIKVDCFITKPISTGELANTIKEELTA